MSRKKRQGTLNRIVRIDFCFKGKYYLVDVMTTIWAAQGLIDCPMKSVEFEQSLKSIAPRMRYAIGEDPKAHFGENAITTASLNKRPALVAVREPTGQLQLGSTKERYRWRYLLPPITEESVISNDCNKNKQEKLF